MRIKAILTDGTTTIDLNDRVTFELYDPEAMSISEPTKTLSWGADTLLRDDKILKGYKHDTRTITLRFSVKNNLQWETMKRNIHSIERMVEKARKFIIDIYDETKVKLYLDLTKGANQNNYLPEPIFGKGSLIFDIYDATFNIPYRGKNMGIDPMPTLTLTCSALGYGQITDVGLGDSTIIVGDDGSVYISGNGQSIAYPTSGNLSASNGVLSIWWKPIDNYTYGTDRYLVDTNNFSLYYEALNDRFVFNDGTSSLNGTAQSFSSNDLLHIVLDWSTSFGSWRKMYINGVLNASDTSYSPAGALGTNFEIGNEDVAENNPCRSWIYDPRIWDTGDMLPADVLDLYNARYGVTELPFVTDLSLENCDDATHDIQTDFYNIPGDVPAPVIMRASRNAGAMDQNQIYFGTRSKDPVNFVHWREAESGITWGGFASAGGGIATDSNQDHLTIAALAAGANCGVYWHTTTNKTLQFGKFRAFIRCRVNGTAAPTYVTWNLQYGPTNDTPGLITNSPVKNVTNNTWELLDLGEVQMPPFDPPYDNLYQIELIRYAIYCTNPASNPNTTAADLDFLFLLPIDENVLLVNSSDLPIDNVGEGILFDSITKQCWNMETTSLIRQLLNPLGDRIFLTPTISPIRFYYIARGLNSLVTIDSAMDFDFKLLPRYLVVR